MNAPTDDRIPVIVAIGEVLDRPSQPGEGREPVELMAQALRAAEADGGGSWLSELGSIDLVGQITWRYRDPVGLLCERLGMAPGRQINASMGGETPIRLIHEAALRIAAGELTSAAIVGGEALSSLVNAAKAGITPNWTPQVSPEEAVKLDFSSLPLSPSAKAAGAVDPVHIYPLYENAFQAAREETPAEGRLADAELWARYAAVATDNPYGWMRQAPDAAEIATPSAKNRMIAFPYPKFMVANPMVNQAAAVIVSSLAKARAAGAPEGNIVYLWGGAAAAEPGDYLHRDRYDHSSAQHAVLAEAVVLAKGGADAFDLMELYSCFPVVPRMALRSLESLGQTRDVAPTVAGGLTFFGGPLNNYMTHAVCAMVRRLRAGEGPLGLLYGQGGVVSKHHALVVSSRPAPEALKADISVQGEADAGRGPAPALLESYHGPATIETWTVVYDAQGEAAHGVVIARTAEGARLIARTAKDDLAAKTLTDMARSAIGAPGQIFLVEGVMVWAFDEM